MIPHFSLQRGKQEYLIIRLGDEFHIIDINEAFTNEKRAAVLESGCTPAQMQEMGLSGMTIPKSDIKALSITGCGAMDDVVFHLRSGTRRFRFAEDYEQQNIEAFLRGIPGRPVRSRKKFLNDWRQREQDPEVLARLRPLGWIWNVLCAVVALWPLFRDCSMEAWGSAVSAVCLTAVVADALFPAYVSILPRQKKERGRSRTIRLTYGLLGVLCVFLLFCRARYFLIGRIHALPAALMLTLILGAVCFLFCPEFRKEPRKGAVALLLVLYLGVFAFIPHYNHVLRPSLQPQTGTIVGKYELINKTGGSDRFIVLLPDGRKVHVHVSWMDFEAFGPGDTLDLQVGTGFFGIDYAMDG